MLNTVTGPSGLMQSNTQDSQLDFGVLIQYPLWKGSWFLELDFICGPLTPPRPSRRRMLTVAYTLIQNHSWLSTLYMWNIQTNKHSNIFQYFKRTNKFCFPTAEVVTPPITCFKVYLSDNLCCLEIHKITKSCSGWSNAEAKLRY